MTGPAKRTVPYPLFLCAYDGVVYDRHRDSWHGLPEIDRKLHCPVCGGSMEYEPKEPVARIFFCYQCGTTYDKERVAWYGLKFFENP